MEDFWYKAKPIKMANGMMGDKYATFYATHHAAKVCPNEMIYMSIFSLPHNSTDMIPILSEDMRFVCGSFGGKIVRIGRVCEVSRNPFPYKRRMTAMEKYDVIHRIDGRIRELQELREQVKRGG